MLEDFRLKVFVTLSVVKNFTRAAEVLHISQPAVSQNISELEKQLGIKLFDRLRGEVVLTPAGEIFLHNKRHGSERLNLGVGAVRQFGCSHHKRLLIQARALKAGKTAKFAIAWCSRHAYGRPNDQISNDPALTPDGKNKLAKPKGAGVQIGLSCFFHLPQCHGIRLHATCKALP